MGEPLQRLRVLLKSSERICLDYFSGYLEDETLQSQLRDLRTEIKKLVPAVRKMITEGKCSSEEAEEFESKFPVRNQQFFNV
jgi:hypothetical protein